MNALEFKNVTVKYGRGAHAFTAVDNVSLALKTGSILGLVGESGSGKSTLARCAVGLVEPTQGSIELDGVDIANARGATVALRQNIQMIFQDPASCLSPRRTIGQSLTEALAAGAKRRDTTTTPDAITRLLETVQLPAAMAHELPATLSGGQKQRVALARALAAGPSVILADEITSALDVSVQGAVLNLVKSVQRELGLSLLFISHNLAVVRYLCDEVAVMKSGSLVESGETLAVLDNPQHPYTQALLAAVPHLGAPLGESQGATA